MSLRKTSLFLIAGAVLLFVLLFISPKTEALDINPDGKDIVPKAQITSKRQDRSSLKLFLDFALKNLEPSKNKVYQILVKNGNSDSLAKFWDELKRPDLASYFIEEEAEKANKAAIWYKAGNRYYYAIRFVQDQSEIPLIYQRAMNCFEKCAELDKTFNDARIMLAACYVEGSEDPMKGISILKSVEQTDSNNIKLQMTFAFFSVKSGQFEKALSRFNKVLQLDSNSIEVYLHLADTYEKMGDKGNTVRMLEKYRSKTNDPTARLEIGKYIEQLSNNN